MMDDSKCIVCEFTNEGGSVAVGYQEWLHEHPFTDEEFDELIRNEKEVKTTWPDCDIGPSSTMKKRLTKECTWETFIIKIHAYGKWIEMCGVRSNLEKYGAAHTSRSDRRILAKRNISNKDEDDDSIKPVQEKHGVISKKHNTTQKSQSKKELDKIQSEQKKNIMKRYWGRKVEASSMASIKDLDDSNSDENVNYVPEREKKLLFKLEALTKDNKYLHEENVRLRALQSVSEYLPRIEEQSKRVLERLEAAIATATQAIPKMTINDINLQTEVSEVIGSTNVIDQTCWPNSLILPSDNQSDLKLLTSDQIDFILDSEGNKSVSPCTPVTIAATKSGMRKNEAPPNTSFKQKADRNVSSLVTRIPSKVSDPIVKDFELDLSDVPSTVVLNQEEDDANGNNAPFEVHSKMNVKKDSSALPTDGPKVDLGRKGICFVSDKALANCNSTTAPKLISDLLAVVFSKDELRTSSLTGKVANIHLNKNVEAKKKLNPEKVDCIKCYVQEQFPNEEKLGDLVKKIVKQKCNNAVRRARDVKRADELKTVCAEH